MNELEIKPNILKEALKYADLGWSIIPLKPGMKEPYFTWKEFQNKKADEATIRAWWEKMPNANIGLITGAISGIVVVDIEKGGKTTGYTPTVVSKTGGGGFHMFYQHPGVKIQNSVKGIADLTDIRGDGGYVVLPPSAHPNGTQYEWGTSPFEADLAPLPDELFLKIKSIDNKESINNLPEKLKGSLEGSRNNNAASVAGSLLAHLPPQDWQTIAWPLLEGWNTKNIPPLSEKELHSVYTSIKERELQKRNGRKEEGQSSKQKIEFKITEAKEMLTKKLEDCPFIIDRLVPEKAITAITADSGKGKSLFMLFLAKHIATGENLFDEFNVKQKNVLIIDQEMNEDLIVERYKNLISAEIPIDYMYEQSWDIMESNSFNWLKERIIQKKYGVIIFDTLTTIHGLDENKSDQMRLVNQKLLELIKETSTTIIYLHHNRKLAKGEFHNQSSARGSTEIVAKVSSLILLDSKREFDDAGNTITTITLKQEKSRRAESLPIIGLKMSYNKKDKTTTFEYLGEVDLSGEKVLEAKRFILKTLGDSTEIEVTVEILYNRSGIGKNSLNTALKQMVANNVLKVRKNTEKPINKLFYSLLKA